VEERGRIDSETVGGAPLLLLLMGDIYDSPFSSLSSDASFFFLDFWLSSTSLFSCCKFFGPQSCEVNKQPHSLFLTSTNLGPSRFSL
jgi:hypothetical protein